MVDVALDKDGKKFHPLIEKTLAELEGGAGPEQGQDHYLPGLGSGRDGVAGPVGPAHTSFPAVSPRKADFLPDHRGLGHGGDE